VEKVTEPSKLSTSRRNNEKKVKMNRTKALGKLQQIPCVKRFTRTSFAASAHKRYAPRSNLGTISILQILRSNSSITSLSLRGTQMFDREAAVIPDTLRWNQTLRSLDLSSNYLGPTSF
jgi:hypothetical protein